MARQKGIIKLKGKVGDLSFYQSKEGNLAREKGGVDGARIANDPAFARTRENGAEFGSSATSGKLVRDAVRSMMLTASDGRVTARLTKLMTSIKNLDTTSARGERTVGTAIALPAATARLKGFNFNSRAILGSVLYKAYTVNTTTGVIEMTDLVPINDIAFPRGATHVTFRGGWAKVEFTTNEQSQLISPFHWTGSKVALVELIYALASTNIVNNGNVEIKDLVRLFEQVFQQKIDSPY